MTLVLFVMWLLITVGVSAMILHQIGRDFGSYVAMSAATRVAVFMGVGTVVGLGIGFVRWLVL